jgi:hypothetical protein
MPYPLSQLAQTDTIVAADRAAERKVPIATNGWMKAVITPRWHLIAHEKRGKQLYDWLIDPEESKNLADTPEGKLIIRSLESQVSANENVSQP